VKLEFVAEDRPSSSGFALGNWRVAPDCWAGCKRFSMFENTMYLLLEIKPEHLFNPSPVGCASLFGSTQNGITDVRAARVLAWRAGSAKGFVDALSARADHVLVQGYGFKRQVERQTDVVAAHDHAFDGSE
jgi:hypothetical protein